MFKVEVKSRYLRDFYDGRYRQEEWVWVMCGIWNTYEEAAQQLAYLALHNEKEYRIREE